MGESRRICVYSETDCEGFTFEKALFDVIPGMRLYKSYIHNAYCLGNFEKCPFYMLKEENRHLKSQSNDDQEKLKAFGNMMLENRE